MSPFIFGGCCRLCISVVCTYVILNLTTPTILGDEYTLCSETPQPMFSLGVTDQDSHP